MNYLTKAQELMPEYGELYFDLWMNYFYLWDINNSIKYLNLAYNKMDKIFESEKSALQNIINIFQWNWQKNEIYNQLYVEWYDASFNLNYKTVIEKFEQLVKINPNDKDLSMKLLFWYFWQSENETYNQNYQNAINYYIKALNTGYVAEYYWYNTNYYIEYLLWKNYYELWDYENAEKYVTSAYTNSLKEKNRLRISSQNIQEFIKTIQEDKKKPLWNFKHNPLYIEAFNAYLYEEDYVTAIKKYEELLKIYPYYMEDMDQLYLDLWASYYELWDYNNSKKYYNLAYINTPHKGYKVLSQSWLWINSYYLEDYDTAKKHFISTIKISVEQGYHSTTLNRDLYWLWLTYYKLKDYENAKKYLILSIEDEYSTTENKKNAQNWLGIVQNAQLKEETNWSTTSTGEIFSLSDELDFTFDRIPTESKGVLIKNISLKSNTLQKIKNWKQFKNQLDILVKSVSDIQLNTLSNGLFNNSLKNSTKYREIINYIDVIVKYEIYQRTNK
jgi:tetratricopeptide (TPR) repeat protein